VKKQLEEVNKEETKEKAALQKQLEAPGALALPDWTPKVPQFEPTGPVSRKIVSARHRRQHARRVRYPTLFSYAELSSVAPLVS